MTSFPSFGTVTQPDGSAIVLQQTNVSSPSPRTFQILFDATIVHVWIDIIHFVVTDGMLNSSVVTLTINVIHINHAPVASSISVSTPENTPILLTLTATDIDFNWGDTGNDYFLWSSNHSCRSQSCVCSNGPGYGPNQPVTNGRNRLC